MRQASKSDEVYAEILAAARLQAREFAQSLHGQRVASATTSSTNNGTSEHASTKRGNGTKTNMTPELAPVKPGRNGHSDTAPLA